MGFMGLKWFKPGSDTCSREIQIIVMVLIGISFTSWLALMAIDARKRGVTMSELVASFSSCRPDVCQETTKVDTKSCVPRNKWGLGNWHFSKLGETDKSDCGCSPKSSFWHFVPNSKFEHRDIIIIGSVILIIVIMIIFVIWIMRRKKIPKLYEPSEPITKPTMPSLKKPYFVPTQTPRDPKITYSCAEDGSCAFGKRDIPAYLKTVGPDYEAYGEFRNSQVRGTFDRN